jgi:hypothetical protein
MALWRPTIKHIPALAIALAACFTLAQASTPIMPLEQVKPGMKGKGRTVFLAGDIEEFDVLILGIIANNQPKRNIILAKFSGRGLEQTGIIQGMSGSPVYIDGKLIGAVAYSFPFSKEPIGGITPIGEMLAVAEEPGPAKPSGVPSLPLQSSLSLADVIGAAKERLGVRPAVFTQGQALIPIGIPLIFGGFSRGVIEEARSLFSGWGFSPTNWGASGQTFGDAQTAGVTLREGDPIAVELVGGDLRVAAVGTVSHVDGDRVLAFGHPSTTWEGGLCGRGQRPGRCPKSGKLVQAGRGGEARGTFSQDRTAGMLGEVGRARRRSRWKSVLPRPEAGSRNSGSS